MAKSMKARVLLKKLQSAGFELLRIEGSHHIYFQDARNRTVIVPVHGMNKEIPVGTVNAILKQAGLR